MAQTSTVLVVTGVTVLASAAAYVAYFDYKRRTDVAFRKELKKQKKKVDKSVKLGASTTTAAAEPSLDMASALELVRNEVVPPGAEAKEKYFMDNVAMGEQLCARGPGYDLPAAMSFFRALRVYPAPLELIMIYQKTVPEAVFKLVMDLTNADVSAGPGVPHDDGIDEDAEGNGTSGAGSGLSASASRSTSRRGPPSETSSHEWDKLTDPGPPSASE